MAARAKYAKRPPECQTCGQASWWNGLRRVGQVVRDAAGAIRYVADVIRRRARCSDRECSQGSFAVYEPGAYPFRGYRLPVVAQAVKQAESGQRLADVATRCLCSRRSVSRWRIWVAELASPRRLARACARLERNPAMRSRSRPREARQRASRILAGLERLATLLGRAGVGLPRVRSGLAKILGAAREKGVVKRLTRASPPLPLAFPERARYRG
jgi:hypothetical protein